MALPNIVIFQILLPLVSPFIDIMFVVGSLKYLIWDKHFHPETADPASFDQLLLFFLMFLVIDFIASVHCIFARAETCTGSSRLVVDGTCLAATLCVPAVVLHPC